jgi:hypothetical protein
MFSLPARDAHGSGTSEATPYLRGGASKANRCGGVALAAGVVGRRQGAGQQRPATLFGCRHTATPGTAAR